MSDVIWLYTLRYHIISFDRFFRLSSIPHVVFTLTVFVKVKVKVSTLDIAPLRGTPHQKRSGTDHTVLPANFTVPASTS